MDSKVFMFPENGYNNNGGFGLGGWGGGLIGFLIGAMLANGGLFGGWGGNRGNGGLSGQINSDANTALVMNAINGTNADVRALASTINCDQNQLSSAICNLNTAIAQLGAQNGMSALQIQNAILSGDANLASQLAQCCCENRLLTTQQGYEGRIQTIEQTNALNGTINANGRSITDAIAAQTTLITKEFCELKEREMQNKINSQAETITQLRNNENNAAQTKQIYDMIVPLQQQVNAIAAKQPNTVPVQWPQITAVNTTPNVNNGWGWNNGWGSNSFWN